MYKKVKWELVLLLVCAIFGILLALTFWPGLYSPDSLHHYSQAKSGIYDNWFPIIYSVMWSFMLKITGHAGGMLMLQLSMFVLSILILSLSVYKSTRSKILSISPMVIIGSSPFVLSIVGTMWKDVLLGLSLLLAVAVMYAWVGHSSKAHNLSRYDWLILLIFSALLIVGGLARLGPPIMIAPLALAAGRIFFKSYKKSVIYSVVLFVSLVAVGLAMNGIYKPAVRNTHVAVMLDDIKKLYSYEDISSSDLSVESKAYVNEIKSECANKGVEINSLFVCGVSVRKFDKMSREDEEAVRDAWLDAIKNQPLEYAKFRLTNFKGLLSPPSIYAWVEERTTPNELGVGIADTRLTNYMEEYYDFSIRDYGFGYRPYFWIILSTFGLAYVWFKRGALKNKALIVGTYASGLVYILQFLPVTIAWDYRYSYWLVLSTSVASVMLLAEIYNYKRSSAHKTAKKRESK